MSRVTSTQCCAEPQADLLHETETLKYANKRETHDLDSASFFSCFTRSAHLTLLRGYALTFLIGLRLDTIRSGVFLHSRRKQTSHSFLTMMGAFSDTFWISFKILHCPTLN